MLITDHQVDETLAITDRSYIVGKGKILCAGTPIEVLSNPVAVKLYFGAKAEFSRKRILEKLGLREEDLPPIQTGAPEIKSDVVTTPQEPSKPASEPRCVSLTLSRRNDGPPRRTPSPRENQTPNRFSEKMGSLFKKKR